MSETAPSTAAAIAAGYEAAQAAFLALVESLTDDQWTRTGKNFPERLNEDEGRTLGVIAHHVAAAGPFIMARISALLEGRKLDPVDIRSMNATHAVDNASVTRAEVVNLLRSSGAEIAAAIRQIKADQLDVELQTPAGPMTLRERLERVLIGHIRGHQAVIEASVA